MLYYPHKSIPVFPFSTVYLCFDSNSIYPAKNWTRSQNSYWDALLRISHRDRGATFKASKHQFPFLTTRYNPPDIYPFFLDNSELSLFGYIDHSCPNPREGVAEWIRW